jgi:hypothetical protein
MRPVAWMRRGRYTCDCRSISVGWLPQASFQFNQFLDRELKRMCFTSLLGDPCVYSGGKSDIRTSVCMHVAELVVRAKKKAREASVRQFESQDLEFSTGTGRSSLI